jgi:hypothetical protein
MEIPKPNRQVVYTSSFEELTAVEFKGEQNAACWQRKLEGDFKELVSKLKLTEAVSVIELEHLNTLQLSEAAAMARTTLLKDYELLEHHGASPTLNLIRNYPKDNSNFPTDVYSFHVDEAPFATSTFLCTYFGETSEICPNEEATQKIKIPELIEAIKKDNHCAEEDFEIYLRENYYHLHYLAKPNAKLIKMQKGELWRLAVESPDSRALACIHRAAVEKPGELRLMLIC